MLIALFYLALCAPSLWFVTALLAAEDYHAMGRSVPAPRRVDLLYDEQEIQPTNLDWRGLRP